MISNTVPRMSSPEDEAVLKEFMASRSAASLAVKRVITGYMEFFDSLRNIDLDGNIGLQTCSHIRAYDMLERIFGEIDFIDHPSEEKKVKSFR